MRENLHRGIPFSVLSEFTNKTRDALDVARVHANHQIGREGTIVGPSKSPSRCFFSIVLVMSIRSLCSNTVITTEGVSDFDWRDATFELALGVPLRDINGKSNLPVRFSRMTYFHRRPTRGRVREVSYEKKTNSSAISLTHISIEIKFFR